MLRLVVRLMDLVQPLGPRLTRDNLGGEAQQPVVIEVDFRRVNRINRLRARSGVKEMHL